MSERPYLIEDVREAVAEMLHDGLTTEKVRALARAEAEAAGNEAQKECIERGPICGVWKEIEKMRTSIGAIKDEQTKALAVLGFWKWAMPIVVAIAVFLGGIVERRLMASPHVAQPAQVQGK